MSFPEYFYRNPDLVAADMDGETVMMSFERGSYFGLGGVGPRIWSMLENRISLSKIVTIVCAEYDVDEETCTADVQQFLEKMIENELVISD